MPNLQKALRDRIVSAVGHSRVYWMIVPQGTTKPYIRLQTVSDPRPQHLGGYDAARTARVQVDVFADSYGAARSGAESLIIALADPATVAGIKFGRVKAEGPRDLGEDVKGGGYVHRSSLDLLVEHSLA